MDHKLLKKFFAGECSPEEQVRIIAWYRSGEADNDLSEQIEAYWKNEEIQKAEDWGKDMLFERIMQNIPETPLAENTEKSQDKKTHWYRKPLFPYAAAVTLLLMISSILYVSRITQDPAVKSLNHYSFIHKETERGEKTRLSLPDGTHILLNSDSRLWYSSNFGEDLERVVYLEGEAFFDVVKDTLHPLKVHSGEIITTVLGTSFNVQAFADEAITVSLVSGKAQIEDHPNLIDRKVYLQPGEQGVYAVEDKLLSKRKYDPLQALAWKEGILYFKNARFSDIVLKLERWYGVEIEVGRKGIEDGFSGSYTHKSLSTVLEGMGFVLGFDYEIKGKTVIIK